MKLKTKKTSETGKKFDAIALKIDAAHKEICDLTEEIGATQWRGGCWAVCSGISALFFPEGFAVPKYFKTVKKGGGYMPSLTKTEGKELQKKIDKLTHISKHELNMCIGFDGAPFKSIGFSAGNEDYYLISLGDDWECTIPDDCEEITISEYNRLVGKENDTEII